MLVGLIDDFKVMVNEWMVVGLLFIIVVIMILGVFGIMVKDKESKRMYDFLIVFLFRVII